MYALMLLLPLQKLYILAHAKQTERIMMNDGCQHNSFASIYCVYYVRACVSHSFLLLLLFETEIIFNWQLNVSYGCQCVYQTHVMPVLE